jgi:single-strand DNA-binding protein
MQNAVWLVGNLGSDVVVREANGKAVASVRVADTSRYFDKAANEWKDGPTNWWTVNLWGELARNAASLAKGTTVIVGGAVFTNEWTDSSGTKRSDKEIRAAHFGPDLNRATATVAKTPRAGGAQY